MAITISGNGTITGISAGGLPDGTVTANDIASGVIPTVPSAVSDLTNDTGFITAAQVPDSGKVLQVQQHVRTDHFSTASTSYVDYLTVTLTPRDSNSKFKIETMMAVASSDTNMFAYCILTRNGTSIAFGDSYASTQRSFIDIGTNQHSQYNYGTKNVVGHWYDSPGTSSAVTYKIQIKRTNSGTIQMNRSANTSDANRASNPSVLIVSEIAG